MVCRVCENFKTCDSPYCGDSSMVQCGYYEKAKQTNADRIRAMTDDELAGFIENPNGKPWYRCGECKWESCKECCLEWLKQEPTVDNGACSANETSGKVQDE